MEKLPARTGWDWIKQGFALFRRQPAEMAVLFMSYMLLVLMVGILPVIGQVLPVVLIPVFAVGFMQACASVEAGQKVTPRLLGTGFKSPALRRLLTLGLLYVVAISLAIAASSLFDDGVFLSVMAGRAGTNTQEADVLPGMLVSLLLYVPAGMAFWHAAVLIAWHNMPLGKAIFYSFFAVLRAGRAFLVYALGWALIGVLAPVFFTSLLGAVVGRPLVMMAVLLPLSLVLTVVMYCSFYPTYTAVFGREQIPGRNRETT